MLNQNKNSIQFNLRFKPKEFEKVKQWVDKLGYISIAQFIRDAVKSFIKRGGN